MRFWYQHHNVNAKSNFQREDQNAAKENRKCRNMGKNFIFYIYLTRNRSNSSQHYYKWYSGTGVFQWILRNFKEHLIYRTSPGDCFWRDVTFAAYPQVLYKIKFPNYYHYYFFFFLVFRYDWGCFIQNLRESLHRKKNRNRRGEDLFAFANLFQKESDIENLRSDHQTAFITTQNVCWNI